MYDEATRSFIAAARPLEGLDLDALPEQLTRAYTAIVSLRVRLREQATPESLAQTLEWLHRLAHTYESTACLLPMGSEHRGPCAFVAATAHKLIHQAQQLSAAESDANLHVELASSSVPALVSSMLLFLVAGAYPDALEIAGQVRPVEARTPANRLLSALLALGRGDLLGLVELQPVPLAALRGTEEELAVQALWRRLHVGLHSLGQELLSASQPHEDAALVFQEVRRESVHEVPFLEARQAIGIFGGPHQIACLLEASTGLLRASATSGIGPPDGVDGGSWRGRLGPMVRRFPFLWANHRAALQNGVLRPGTSACVSYPTGAGKTTLIMLKIAATVLATRRSVLVLAPTLALVGQYRRDLWGVFPEYVVGRDFDDEPREGEDEAEPRIVVSTPERALAGLGADPEPYQQLGLIVFDECHHLGLRSGERRCLDATLCLLNLLALAPKADVLLVSAMMANTDELAQWLEQRHGRPCLALKDTWKPTRQVRGCVVIREARRKELDDRVQERRRTKLAADGNPPVWEKKPGSADKAGLTAKPLAFYCLHQSWRTRESADYALQPLLDEELPLSAGGSENKSGSERFRSRWYLTANRNAFAAAIAAQLGRTGIRTMVLSHSAKDLPSLAKDTAKRLKRGQVLEFDLTDQERRLVDLAAEELGGKEHTYLPYQDRVPIHHGRLIEPERRLSESLFARPGGARVLVVSPTLSQGVNLPAEAVIIAGDDQWDIQTNKGRRDIGPEELLNAAGRAGRAGSRSAGVVLVVPGKPVGIDTDAGTLGERWFHLQETVFSKSDQCLSIDDPLTALLDRLQVLAVAELDEETRYVLTRLPVETVLEDGTGGDEARAFLAKSLAAFQAARRGSASDFDTKVDHALALRRELLEQRPATWQLRVASRTGLALEDVWLLASGFDAQSELPDSVPAWASWWFRWINGHAGDELGRIAAPLLREMFSEVKPNALTPEPRLRILLCRAEELLGLWMRGQPLNDLQLRLDAWKEADNPRPRPPQHSKRSESSQMCAAARQFVLAGVRRLSYQLAGLAMVYSEHRQVPSAPAALQALSGCVRHGFDCPEQYALYRIQAARSRDGVVTRLQVRAQHQSLADRIRPASSFHEDFKALFGRVREAMREAE